METIISLLIATLGTNMHMRQHDSKKHKTIVRKRVHYSQNMHASKVPPRVFVPYSECRHK